MSASVYIGLLRSTLAAIQDRGLDGVPLADAVADVLADVVAGSIDDAEARKILATPAAQRMATSPDPGAVMLEGVSQLLCVAGAYRRCPEALKPPKAAEPGLGTAVVG